ncbi:septum formation initiator family protein [soil metagenome]
MKKYAYLYTNKYLIASLIFLVWLLFFDRNDLFSQLSYRKDLKKIKAEKEYYLEEIDENKKDMKELMSDPEHLEKYAREHYLMKKDNEEIFLVLPDSNIANVEYKE